jgi:hypothetical protein
MAGSVPAAVQAVRSLTLTAAALRPRADSQLPVPASLQQARLAEAPPAEREVLSRRRRGKLLPNPGDAHFHEAHFQDHKLFA